MRRILGFFFLFILFHGIKSFSKEEKDYKKIKIFQEVLEDILDDFSLDLKSGKIKNLKRLAIRKIDVSQALPLSYRETLKYLIGERIWDDGHIQLVHCLSCDKKISQAQEGKWVIQNPIYDDIFLKETAEKLQIDGFLDAMLAYHTSHMILSLRIVDPNNQKTLWTKSYSSLSPKNRFKNMAIDYSQVKPQELKDTYTPEYRTSWSLGGGGIPNIGGIRADGSMATFQVRASERFDHRQSEFGLLLASYWNLNSLSKSYPLLPGTGGLTKTEDPVNEDYILPAEPKPFTMGLSLQGLYGKQFLGFVEDYNKIRHGFHMGAGFFLAPSYLAPSTKLGWDIFLGRRFLVSFTSTYLLPSQILLDSQFVPTQGGLGGEILVGFQF